MHFQFKKLSSFFQKNHTKINKEDRIIDYTGLNIKLKNKQTKKKVNNGLFIL